MKAEDVTTMAQLELAIAGGAERITIRGKLCGKVKNKFSKNREEAEKRFKADSSLLMVSGPFLHRYALYYITEETADTLTVERYHG